MFQSGAASPLAGRTVTPQGLLVQLNDGTPLPPVRLTSITDGTSNTLMLGEKFVPTDLYSAATAWGDNNPWPTGADWTVYRCANQQPKQDIPSSAVTQGTPPPNAAAAKGACGPWGLGAPTGGGGYYDYWGSAHPAGFNAALSDGSVRTIKYSISLPVLQALATRSGGEPVDPTGF